MAHALANTCRFGGHCARHYSVAQHSVHVSHIVANVWSYTGLMHDAPEFVIGDMVKPLKEEVMGYKSIERTIELAVFRRFDVSHPLPPCVKEADMVMLATEQAQLFPLSRERWQYTGGRKPLDMVLPVMTPAEAERAFLDRYAELRP